MGTKQVQTRKKANAKQSQTKKKKEVTKRNNIAPSWYILLTLHVRSFASRCLPFRRSAIYHRNIWMSYDVDVILMSFLIAFFVSKAIIWWVLDIQKSELIAIKNPSHDRFWYKKSHPKAIQKRSKAIKKAIQKRSKRCPYHMTSIHMFRCANLVSEGQIFFTLIGLISELQV